MQHILPGYRVTHTLYESEHSLIYRGWRDADLLPVILKQFKPQSRHPDELTRFEREYALTRRLRSTRLIQAHELIHHDGRSIMVLEDIGGESLRALRLAGTWPLASVLTLAISLCESLDDLHQQQVIHKDLNPSNIVLNQTTGQMQLIDFGLASEFSGEYAALRHPHVIEGTLAYMSPEQTGRMNRSIDFRADFYALGVTLYELLTGRLPFESHDALTLVHAHIAKYPAPPHECLSPARQIGSQAAALRVFSDIIMKLLAKNADDRYQSTPGIQHDLAYCQKMLPENGEPSGAFRIGQHDISGRFVMPQKLYGRERETAALLAAVERVAHGATELMLTTGDAGIGKTSAAFEIQPALAMRRGYFLAGKFDPLQPHAAYSALTLAFDCFCDNLLAESAEEFAVWRQRILAAVGENGQALFDLIPQLVNIIGAQPPLPPVGMHETQQRFFRTFRQFAQAACHPDHPVALFLDDLQWADAASLHLLHLLLTDADLHSLLVIATYREDSLTEGHPLRRWLRELAESGAVMHAIRLAPLQLENVAALVQDTLAAPAPPLSELIFAKTEGNPFFVRQFFQSLYDNHAVRFDAAARQWTYEMPRLLAMQLTDNVAALLLEKITRLPERIRQTLRIASCLGFRFDLPTLAAICREPVADVASDMRTANAEGIVIALSAEQEEAEYQFAHDHLRQAAHAELADAQKPALHLDIARRLHDRLSENEREERLFELVEHWNAAASELTDGAEKQRLAELNLRAGRKAKASAAYQAAISYYSAGIAMTDAADWESRRALMFALHDELAEAAHLGSDPAIMTQAISVARSHARNRLETVRSHETEMIANMAQGRIPDAVRVGLAALREFGLEFPEQPTQDDFVRQYGAIRAALAGRNPMELTALPAMTNPEGLAALRLLVAVYAPTFFCRPDLIPHIIMQQAALSLQYGNAPLSPLGYATFGLLLCGPLQEYELGYQFGQLAAELVKDPASAAIRTHTTQMLALAVLPWHVSLHACIVMLRENYEAGMALGDAMYAMYSANTALFYGYWGGIPLEMLMAECQTYLRAAAQHPYVLERIKFAAAMIACMRGDDADPAHSTVDLFSERMSVAPFEASHDAGMQFLFYLNKMYVAFLFAQPEESLRYADMVRELLPSSIGIYVYPLSFFYDALIQVAAYHLLAPEQQQLAQERIAAALQQLTRWAELCPANFAHKHALVQAESHRLAGRFDEALDAYDEAVRLAKSAGFLHDEALANELAALFWMRKGKPHLASPYMHHAWTCYQLWGAHPKIHQLEAAYPELFLKPPSGMFQIKTDTSSSSTRPTEVFDLAAMMKAAQTISKELTLPELSTQLMLVMTETAGAERAALLLREQEDFVLYAQCDAATSRVELLSEPLRQTTRLPRNLLEYALRKQDVVLLDNASADARFLHDPYIRQCRPKSALALPILHRGSVIGVLYFENNLAEGAFLLNRVGVLRLLAEQAAISLEHAHLYRHIEQRVQERTAELNALNASLQQEIAERRRIEDQLHESQELFTAFMEYLPALAFIKDANGRVLYVNNSFERQMGEGWLNKTAADKLPETLAQTMRDDDDATLARGMTEQIEEVPTFTGGLRMFQTVKFRIDRPGHPLRIGGLALDVTAIKQTEEALREHRNLLLTIADNLPAYIAYVDAETLRYKFANKLFENLGLPRDQIIGKTIKELIGETKYAVAFPYLEKVRAGEPTVYENEFHLVNGTRLIQVNYVPEFDEQGRVRGIVVLGRDMTLQKQIERALQESQKLLLLIADNLPAFIAYADAADLRYRFVNKRYEAFGRPRHEIINKTFPEVVGDAGYKFAKPYLEQVFSGRSASYENLFHLTHGDRWIKVNYVPDIDEQRQVRGIVILSYDITQEKQNAEALQLAKESAESANRVKSLFLASMSHELRTPLNAIIGFAQLLAYSPKIPPEVRDYVEIIQRSSTHLLSLINQVLDLSKIEAGRMTLDEKPMNLYALLDELEEMFWLKAEHKGLYMRFERDRGLPCGIVADELKLRQILINLLNNALKFTQRGSVTTRILRLPMPSPSTMPADPPSAHALLQFSVEDTGAGIAPEELDAIFTPFIQTGIGRQEREGTGLGLPISRKFVQLMGGDIHVRSELGRGSLFTFTIPTRVIDTMETSFEPLPPRRVIGLAPNQPRYNILIVDDHAESRALLRSLLQPLGFDVEDADSGSAALEICQRWQPDMIWIDVCMPAMDGYETVRRIREREQSTGTRACIIATSAASGKNELATAHASGCDDFLRKPLKDADIFDRLRTYLDAQFIYADEKPRASHPRAIQSPAMIRDAIAALPEDLRATLKQAMIMADIAQILHIATRIGEYDVALRDTILDRAKQFDYQPFLEALHSLE